jgi:hypothetical protein
MKARWSLLAVFASILMLMSCEEWWGNYPIGLPPKYVYSKPFEIPVDAYFNTTFCKNKISGGYMELNGPVCQIVQTGSGSDGEIGYFQIRLTCCWSMSDCIAGRSGGYLIDGMGNTIYIKCNECLTADDLTADFPQDQACITGRFEFTGGTGCFEGVKGEGTINCLVTSDGKVAAMSHHWEGYIKYPRPI